MQPNTIGVKSKYNTNTERRKLICLGKTRIVNKQRLERGNDQEKKVIWKILTVVVNVFLPSLSLRLAGIKALGYHMAKPAIITQRMAISSSNCPNNESVA